MSSMNEEAMVGAELRERLLAYAVKAAQSDFHAPSKTHIFYCAPIGRHGAKGFGDFSNEAFADYCRRVEALLSQASNEDLEYWSKKIELAEQVRSVAENESSGQVCMTTSKEMRAEIDKIAGRPESSRAKFVQECIEKGLQRLERYSDDKDPNELVEALRARLDEVYTRTDSNSCTWTMRLPRDTHARLSLYARQLETTPPQLSSLLIVAALHT